MSIRNKRILAGMTSLAMVMNILTVSAFADTYDIYEENTDSDINITDTVADETEDIPDEGTDVSSDEDMTDTDGDEGEIKAGTIETSEEDEASEEEESEEESSYDVEAVKASLAEKNRIAAEGNGISTVGAVLTEEEAEYVASVQASYFGIVMGPDGYTMPVKNYYFAPGTRSTDPYSQYSSVYYYEQLNTAEKQLYDELYNVCSSFMDSSADIDPNVPYVPANYWIDASQMTVISGNYTPLWVNRAFQVYNLFYYENPQFFFIRNAANISIRSFSSGEVQFCVYPIIQTPSDKEPNATDFTLAANRNSYRTKIHDLISVWQSGIDGCSGPLAKQEYIYKAVSDHVSYDFSYNAPNWQTIAGAADGSCVCNGYALMTSLLLNYAGIENIIVSSGDLGNHAWNYVKLYGEWYNFDVTWIDQTDKPIGYNLDWLNKSTDTFRAGDAAQYMTYRENQYAHLVDTSAYTYIVLPVCSKDFDPGSVITAPSTLVSISAVTSGDVYYIGDELDLSAITVTASYSDGSSANINIADCTVEGFDSVTEGTKTVTVTYEGKTAEFTVTVSEDHVSYISLTGNIKTEYFVGAPIDLTGTRLTVVYASGKTGSVDVDTSMVSGFDTATAGTKTVTVTYGENTTSYNITVIADSVSRISLIGTIKTDYFVGDAIDLTGTKLSVVYASGATDTINADLATVTGFNTASAGNRTVTVTYGGKTASYIITVSSDTVSNISLTGTIKTEYFVGDAIDLTGTKLNVVYASGKTASVDVTSAMVSGFNTLTAGTRTFTVTYSGKSTYCVITVSTDTVSSISLTGTIKTEYFVGDAIDLTGTKLNVVYASGKTSTVDVTSSMVSGFTTATVGTKAVTVSYGGRSTSCSVTVKADSVSRISLIGTIKTEYFVGDAIDLTGTKLSVVYASGKTATIDAASSMVSGFNTQTAGTRTVTVTYGGKTASYNITVTADIVNTITLTGTLKKNYFVGDQIELTGTKLSAAYLSGKTQIVNVTTAMVSGFNTATAGTKTVTVTYGGKSTYYTITVTADTVNTVTLTGTVKKNYFTGDQIDLTGTKLNAVYVSGKTETVDVDETMVSGFNTQSAGTKAVTVTYNGKSVSYTITVTADTVNAVTLAGSLKKNYFTGDAIDLTGTKLSVVYASGKTASVDVTGAMVSGFNTQTAGTRTVTVSYGGRSTTYQITVKTPALVSISMANIPRTEYIVGASLDESGGSIRAEYENGTVKTVTLTASMVSGFNSSRTGTYTLTVTYSGKTTSYDITVRDAEVTSVTISAKPKTAYYIGDAIDLTNGRITVVYENGTSKVMAITADMISGFDTSSAGTKTITVTYGGKTASYTITVTADAVRTVAVTGTFKKIYFVGDDIDLTGAKLNVTYNSGKTASVDVTSAMVSGFNTQTAGTRTVTVIYGGKSTAYSITVKADTVKTIALAGTVRKEYYVDDELDLSGTKLDVAYESGKTALIDVTSSMVTGFTSATAGNKILYVTYSGKRITYTVTVRVLAVVKVSMANTPKTDYVTGNTLDVTGGTIKVDYENGTSKTIAMTTAMVSGFNSATAGNKTLTVTYNGKQTSYVITVREPDVASITILSKPKTAYFVGDELNITGGRINVKYENNTTKIVNITADMISEFDTSSAGTKTITVAYGGKTASYTITVTADAVRTVAVTGTFKKIYFIGDDIDLTGAKLNVTYNSGKTASVDVTSAMVSGFNTQTAGTRTVTVTYGGKSTAYSITVKADTVKTIALAGTVRREYYVDDELDLSGTKLDIAYESGKTASIDVTASMVTGFTSATPGNKTLYVTYGGKRITYTVTVRTLAVVKVSMANTPKTDYVTGNTLDVTGGTIKVDYENDTSKTIAMTTAMVSGFNSATAGNKTLTVTYNGKQTSYVITVREPDVASITILSKPKTAYFVGDELNITGGRINVKYENNTTKTVNITADMISGFVTSAEGQKDVTVTYGGKTAVYQITVTAVKAVSLTVSKMPAKIRYYTGDELDITGAKITVRYNNSKTEIFDMTDAMVSGFDSSTAGSKRVTVTFEGVSGYMNLTVIALAVNSIKLEKAPDKTSYYLDQELDLTGGSMTVTYNSGKTESISMTAEGVTATGYAPQRVGTQTITVRYLNRSVTYSIQMSIDPDNAPVVLDGAGYLKVSDALRMIKTAGDYEIKVYKDITENSLMFPQAATKITVTSVGGAVIKASSVTANTDLVLNAVIAPVQSGGTVSLRAGNNKQLVINKENLELGTVSGSKTSSLIINANVKAQSVSTFGTVKTAGGSALEITRTMSGVDLAEGTIKLSTAAASCMATIVNSGNTEFILTAGAQNVSTGKLLLPKVTFTKINEGCKLRVKVVDGNGSMVILPASQPVLYTTGTLSYTNSIVVENAITGHDSNIKAFLYQREYRAEYAKALTLECSTGKISGDYSTFEALFNAINSNASDTSAYYRIVLNNDVTAEKFTLPARAGIGMEIDGASHVFDLYGVSSLSPRYAFTLKNMKLRSYNARAARDMDISITATTGDLTLYNISSQHLTAVRGSANTTLNIENYDDMGMAPAIQTFKAVNLINSSITSGKAFNASELNIDNSVFTAAQATVNISKSIHGENNARIALVNGFRPITINGTASGSISLIGANGYMPAENTQILNSLTADVTVFDVTAIVPDNGITYGLARNGRVNKVTLNGLSLCVNDTKFAFWSEAVTFIESGRAIPAADDVYEIKLLGDHNIGSRIYFPRNKAVRIVSDDPATLTFTSFTSPTAGIEAENISLVCMNMNGLPIKYSISCSAADAVLRFKNCDMMTCMSITAARSTVILEGTTCFGGLTVSANELMLDKNVVCRFEGMTVNKLTVDDNMHINILDRRSYRVVSGLYGKELSVSIVNAQDQPVSITRGTVIVFTGYTEQYDNNVYVTNYNEYAVKDRSNRVIINVG